MIPPARPGGRPRKTDMRAAMNAILYLLRTGCPWRYLPRYGFPPRSTVYNIFRKFQHAVIWEAIWGELHMVVRERTGREPSRSAAVLDSQSVKSAEKRAAKTTRWVTIWQEGEGPQNPRLGRQRRATDAGRPRLRRHSRSRRAGLVPDKIRRRFPWPELIWADVGYNGTTRGRLKLRWQRCRGSV
jgi:putative transposase